LPITVVAGFFTGFIPAVLGSVGYCALRSWQFENSKNQHVVQKIAPQILKRLAEQAEKLKYDGVIPITLSQAQAHYEKLKEGSARKDLDEAFATFKYLSEQSFHVV
jgi:hypothetical protein